MPASCSAAKFGECRCLACRMRAAGYDRGTLTASIGVSEGGEVVLTLLSGGAPAVVIPMTPQQARLIGGGLLRGADLVDQSGQKPGTN